MSSDAWRTGRRRVETSPWGRRPSAPPTCVVSALDICRVMARHDAPAPRGTRACGARGAEGADTAVPRLEARSRRRTSRLHDTRHALSARTVMAGRRSGGETCLGTAVGAVCRNPFPDGILSRWGRLATFGAPPWPTTPRRRSSTPSTNPATCRLTCASGRWATSGTCRCDPGASLHSAVALLFVRALAFCRRRVASDHTVVSSSPPNP